MPFDDVEVFLYLTAQMPDRPLPEVADLCIDFKYWDAERTHAVVPMEDAPTCLERLRGCVWRVVVAVCVAVTVFVVGYVSYSHGDRWPGPLKPATYQLVDGRHITVWGRHRVTTTLPENTP